VYSIYQYQLLSHDPYLWWDLKCYGKGTSGHHKRVPKHWEVSLELGRGLEEKYNPISENWGHSGAEM